MTKFVRRTLLSLALLAVVLAALGCHHATEPGGAGRPPQPANLAPTADPGADVGTSPNIKQIMTKLTKGRASLTPVLGNELKQEPPPWETIQSQTREFDRLAAALGQNPPPKGSKESWAELTAAYAASAKDLDRAAQAKDRDAALAAHGKLATSCQACHREHRGGRPGMGGPP
jgi:hypothetical protein